MSPVFRTIAAFMFPLLLFILLTICIPTQSHEPSIIHDLAELRTVGRYLGRMYSMTYTSALETSKALGLGAVVMSVRFNNGPRGTCGSTAVFRTATEGWLETLAVGREILCEPPEVYAVHTKYQTAETHVHHVHKQWSGTQPPV